MVVTPTGLRSTGGSLSQRLDSVHSWPTVLSRVDLTHYVVTVDFAVDARAGLFLVLGTLVSAAGLVSVVDFRTRRRRVALAGSGGLGSLAMILYGVDVLSIA